MALMDDRTGQEHEEVQTDIDDDVDQLQRSEFHRFVLITQIDKGNAGQGVNGHDDSHDAHIFRMGGITQ